MLQAKCSLLRTDHLIPEMCCSLKDIVLFIWRLLNAITLLQHRLHIQPTAKLNGSRLKIPERSMTVGDGYFQYTCTTRRCSPCSFLSAWNPLELKGGLRFCMFPFVFDWIMIWQTGSLSVSFCGFPSFIDHLLRPSSRKWSLYHKQSEHAKIAPKPHASACGWFESAYCWCNQPQAEPETKK